MATHKESAARPEESSKRAGSFTKTIIARSMRAEEVIGFIDDKENAAMVATVRKDGPPHTGWNPVAYVADDLYTCADPHSVCHKDMEREGRVSVAIKGGNEAVFILGKAKEIGHVNKLIDTLLAEILSVVRGRIPRVIQLRLPR